MLDRAKTEGRTVPVETMIKTHEGAAKTVQQLYERYAGNPEVDFQFIDNSGPHSSEGTVALTRKQNYRETRGRLYAILERQRSRLPGSIYEATRGTAGESSRP